MTIQLKILIALILLIGAFAWGYSSKKIEIVETRTTDTVTVVKYDTLTIEKPKIVQTIIVDTVKIHTLGVDTVYLPREQKYYSEVGKYDAWVSGVMPSLDSIKVYNKTEVMTVTNEIVKTVYPKEWELWGGVGVGYYNNVRFPKCEIELESPFGVALSGGIGYLNSAPMYDLTVKFRISKW